MRFEKLYRELEKKKIQYLLVGGIAVNLHGYARFTADLDLFISLDNTNVENFIHIVKQLGYSPRVPVKIEDFADPKKRKEWINKKHMKVFSLIEPKKPLEHVDILIIHEKQFKKYYPRRDQIKIDDFSLSVISLSDLIQMKKEAGRGRDLIDIGALRELEKIKKAKKNKSKI